MFDVSSNLINLFCRQSKNVNDPSLLSQPLILETVVEIINMLKYVEEPCDYWKTFSLPPTPPQCSFLCLHFKEVFPTIVYASENKASWKMPWNS